MSLRTTDNTQEVDVKKDGSRRTSYEEIHIEGSSSADDVDPAFERKLKWKIDLFILPLISSVYFFASMGRSDLGNAKIAGMSKELKLSAQDYSNAATMFLVGYIVLQIPGTLLIKKLRAPVQFAGAMLIWGFLTAMTVLIQNTGELLLIRFLIGAAEAFVQGGVFYLSFWYQYRELATRGAIFFSMSTVAGAFNGLIAYGIAKDLDGAHGWRAWRWIFLIEGIMPCAFSFVVLLLLPADPKQIRYGFTPSEKAEAIRRGERAHNNPDARLEWKKVPRVLGSIHFWLFLVIACGGHFCLSSFSNFLPPIIRGFGWDEVNSQLFTVIVYVCACIGVLFWARVADKTNSRGFTLAASSVGSVIGYALLIGVTNRDARFFATCMVAFFMYPNVVLQLSWTAMSFVGYTRRGSSLAFLNIFSQLFAIAGTQAYSDPPYYRRGNSAALGLSVVVLLCSLILRWYLGYLNKKKLSLSPEKATELRQKSLEELGDQHPDFVYTL